MIQIHITGEAGTGKTTMLLEAFVRAYNSGKRVAFLTSNPPAFRWRADGGFDLKAPVQKVKSDYAVVTDNPSDLIKAGRKAKFDLICFDPNDESSFALVSRNVKDYEKILTHRGILMVASRE